MIPMRKTVLIATRDPHISYLLQRYAEESGYLPVRANPASVWDAARTALPALIILEPEALSPDQQNSSSALSIPILLYTCGDTIESHALPAVAGYLHESVLYNDFVAALQNIGIRP